MKDLPYSKARTLKRSREKRRGYAGPEDDLQRLCEEYLEALKLDYLHIPRKAYRTGAIEAGWPDLMIFRKDGEANSCLMIELKNRAGHRTTAQERLARHLNISLCRTFEEVQAQVEAWIKEDV